MADINALYEELTKFYFSKGPSAQLNGPAGAWRALEASEFFVPGGGGLRFLLDFARMGEERQRRVPRLRRLFRMATKGLSAWRGFTRLSRTVLVNIWFALGWMHIQILSAPGLISDVMQLTCRDGGP